MQLASPSARRAPVRARALSPLALALAWFAMATSARVRADELRQSDWSAGPGLTNSSDLGSTTGFASVSGQWSYASAGELRASPLVFRGGAGNLTYVVQPVPSASSALAYVGFGACALLPTTPLPACRGLSMFVHRDTLSGALSLVAMTDGTATMGCAGSYTGVFSASAGVTLDHSQLGGEVTLMDGSGAIAHTWADGCGAGYILGLPSSFSVSDGAITSRTNLQRFDVLVDALGGVPVEVPLGSLPNNGAAGTPVPFAFSGGLLGSLESAVFALGAPRSLGNVTVDAALTHATLTVYVRTGVSESELRAAAWSGPYAPGDSLASIPAGTHLQYRVDVTLDDVSGMPGEPAPYALLSELRIELAGGCPCFIAGACFAEGERNPANDCEHCEAASSASTWTLLGDGSACDDARFCTAGDLCGAGVCVGGASPCGDGLSCTDDVCDEALDACQNVIASGCVVDGTCVLAGATNPLDACEICDPLLPAQWSVAPGCSGCNTSGDCTSPGLGVCDVSDHACVECSASDRSACLGATPVCDATNRACRGCALDDECGDPGATRCSPTGACVACLSDLDCGGATPICDAGACVACASDTQCFGRDPGAARCDALSGRCGACSDDLDCRSAAGGELCLDEPEGKRCGCAAEADCGVGLTCDVTRERCFPLASADSDDDGVPDDKDADDDNDGITDLVEGGGTDFSRDADEDGIPDWRDADAAGFTDANGDGSDDRSDADGDAIPNQLDLDADNDGIPDVLENAGRDVVDRDRGGRLDDGMDRDRDGLVATADADDDDAAQTTSIVTLMDTDLDGTPDYLDADSDTEGAGDTLEGGGADGDADGALDGFSDGNMNGLADRVDPAAGGDPLVLPDTDGDGRWDFQDDSNAPRVEISGGALCTLHPGPAPGGLAWVLGLLGLGLLRTRGRRRARGRT